MRRFLALVAAETLDSAIHVITFLTCAYCLGIFPFAVAAEWKPAHSDLRRWGVPEGTQVTKGKFLLAFDGRTRVPRWVLECLTQNDGGDAVRSNQWHVDADVPAEFRPHDGDYLNVHGFDRFHFAPAGDYAEQDDQDATFTFSNCGPGNSELNRGEWAQLEKYVRSLAADGATVWVLTCPIFDDEQDPDLTVRRVGKNRVWVPTHFAKAVLVLEKSATVPTLRTWLIPNRTPKNGETFEQFAISVDEMERRAGLDAWSKLDPQLQKRLEAAEP
jgi:endonuclease G